MTLCLLNRKLERIEGRLTEINSHTRQDLRYFLPKYIRDGTNGYIVLIKNHSWGQPMSNVFMDLDESLELSGIIPNYKEKSRYQILRELRKVPDVPVLSLTNFHGQVGTGLINDSRSIIRGESKPKNKTGLMGIIGDFTGGRDCDHFEGCGVFVPTKEVLDKIGLKLVEK